MRILIAILLLVVFSNTAQAIDPELIYGRPNPRVRMIGLTSYGKRVWVHKDGSYTFELATRLFGHAAANEQEVENIIDDYEVRKSKKDKSSCSDLLAD